MGSVAWIYLTNFFTPFIGAIFFRSLAVPIAVTLPVHFQIMWWWMLPMVLEDMVLEFNFFTIIPVYVGSILGIIFAIVLDTPRFIDFGKNMKSWRWTVFNGAMLVIVTMIHFVWDMLVPKGLSVRFVVVIFAIIVYSFLYFGWTYLKIWESYPNRLINRKRTQYIVIFLAVSNIAWIIFYTASLFIVDDTHLSFISLFILAFLQLAAIIIFAWILNGDKETRLTKKRSIPNPGLTENTYF